MAIKDTTPVFEGDEVLKRKERMRTWAAHASKKERLSLLTEDQLAEKQARYERCVPVAHDILEESRAALAVRFRFLDQALWRMPFVPSPDIYGISTDGIKMVYDPEYVVKRFKLSPDEVVRDVVHCLFHCIFRHPFMLYSVVRQPWDVACDIAIESILLDLVGDSFPSNMDRRARQALRLLRAKLDGVVTAERLYRLFSGEGSAVDLTSLSPIFFHDAHGLWYGEGDGGGEPSSAGAARQIPERREGAALPSVAGSEQLDDVRGGAGGGESEEADGRDRVSRDDADGSGREHPSEYDDALAEERQRLADEWEDVSRRMQVELESQMVQRGEGAGNLIASLTAMNRERYDYAEFLKRFAVLHERMRTSPDEFDYIYYLYGLDRYGNMPLIEPLEYREDRSICDFVIAIDTSESVSGDLVQGFMRKTYNILKQVENFHDRVNIHIVQCDARVQEDTKITSLDQLDAYLEAMELRGFGGTDFRPVFEYVNLLVEKREFSDLRGLVYFTDGQGTFPRRPPAYDTVFVFLDDGYSDPEVPPWAFKVILDERSLRTEPPSMIGGK